MTIVVRIENVLGCDGLMYHGGPSGVHLTYSPKMVRNAKNTCIMINSGNNSIGAINVEHEKYIDLVLGNYAKGVLPTLDDISDSYKKMLLALNLGDEESQQLTGFFFKRFSIVLRSDCEKIDLYYLLPKEVTFFGSGAHALNVYELDDKSVHDLVSYAINNTDTCGGDCYLFDLNTLEG